MTKTKKIKSALFIIAAIMIIIALVSGFFSVMNKYIFITFLSATALGVISLIASYCLAIREQRELWKED